MSLTTAVVILNWNGKHHLQNFLPTLIARTKDADIIIADGNSSDGSQDFLREKFPQLRLIQLDDNYGFAGGYNKALEQVDADILVLLNSDVEVHHNWLPPLVAHLNASSSNGACQPKILSYHAKDSFEHAGASGGFMDVYGFPFCRGRLFDSFEKDKGQYNDTIPVFWATGTCLAIKNEVWKQAQGFDADLFAHMEEIDLCWRIARTGKVVHVVPSSTVYHVGGGTLPYKHPRKTYLNFRNSLIVLTKNAPGPLAIRLIKRFVLDAVAAWKFLLEGNASHFMAVAKAHLHFILGFGHTLKKRRTLKRNAPPTWVEGSYQRSIAWQFFLKKRRRFSELDPNDFRRSS